MTAAGTTESTDKSLGLGMVFAGLALAASLLTVAAPTQFLAALGFGAAVTAGVCSVAAIHVFD